MKNKNLGMIAKASLKSHKASSAMFCFFVIVSFVLIFTAIGIVVPFGNNIVEKLNNHIIEREIDVPISSTLSEEGKKAVLERLSRIPGVIEVYREPTREVVQDTSGKLHSSFRLSWVHVGYELHVIDGRAFDETETGVMLLPKSFTDYDAAQNLLYELDGKDFLGETLVLEDSTGALRQFEVVGTYDNTDPIFHEKELLIPRSELIAINEYAEEFYSWQENSNSTPKDFYVVLMDSSESVQRNLEQIQSFIGAYSNQLNIDTSSYNIAFIIILIAAILFIMLTVFGFYMFLKSSVSVRTSELALLRAMGFKSKDLFKSFVTEYLLRTAVALLLGIAAAFALAFYVVNPYLFSLFGNTIMEVSVSLGPLYPALICAGYLVLTCLVCIAAVKCTEKIDLTVLLRE